MSDLSTNGSSRWIAWRRILHDPGMGLGTRLTLLLLLGGLGLSGFLLYQTISAQHSHREAVELGLENLSVLVADRLMVPVLGDWITASHRAFAPVRPLVEGATVEDLPHPSMLSSDDLRGGNCECSLAPDGAFPFRFDLTTDELVFGEGPSEGPSAERIRDPLVEVAAHHVNDNVLWRLETRPTAGIVVVEEGDKAWAVLFAMVFEETDRPGWFYGFAAPAGPFMEGSLASLSGLAPRLLPPEFRAPDEVPVLAWAEIHTTDRSHIMSRIEVDPGADAGSGPATTVTGPQQGSILDQLRLTASLHPDFLEWLPVPVEGDDRTHLYLLLVLLNAGLVAVALVQIGRESTFLRRRAEFVAGFSHEARNPLATIRLYVQGLRFGRISEPEKRDRALDIIDRESRRLVHMVANFLSHGAREEGALRLSPHPVEVADEVRAFTASVRSEVGERNAAIQVECEHALWVRADPTALQQVLRNLVENALKYGPEGQTIRIGTARMNGLLELWVEDEGPGIPPSERDSIFEPFMRTPAAIRSGAGGSGLGLSVVRELVLLQGGTVAVAPARHGGSGARLIVRLPIVDGADDSPETFEPTHQPSKQDHEI